MTDLYLVEKNRHVEHIVVSFQNILDGMVDLYLVEKKWYRHKLCVYVKFKKNWNEKLQTVTGLGGKVRASN